MRSNPLPAAAQAMRPARLLAYAFLAIVLVHQWQSKLRTAFQFCFNLQLERVDNERAEHPSFKPHDLDVGSQRAHAHRKR